MEDCLEIERKFLVCGDFRPSVRRSVHLVQGYICTEHGRTVRVRLSDGRGFLTIKGPGSADGTTRFEWEKEIPPDEAGQLLRLCVSEKIDKTRHLVDFGGHTFEVDEFHGDNEGLVFAELELKSPDEPFARPDWLGKEVTGDVRYYNSYLSEHPYRSWKE